MDVAQDAAQPPTSLKDPSKEKETSHNMEIVLATHPIPIKEDLKGKGLASSTAASAQPTKLPTKDKFVIKMKPRAFFFFFFLLFLFPKFVVNSPFCNQLALFLRLSSMIIINFSSALVIFA